MAVLNELLPQFQNLNAALVALGNQDKLITFDYVKTRQLQKEQRSDTRCSNFFETHAVSAVHTDDDKSRQGLNS